jgi:hypothetical protein
LPWGRAPGPGHGIGELRTLDEYVDDRCRDSAGEWGMTTAAAASHAIHGNAQSDKGWQMPTQHKDAHRIISLSSGS